MAKLIFIWLLLLIASGRPAATGAGEVKIVSGEASTRSKTKVSSDIFMSSKLPEGLKCDDYHCGSTRECPKTCYCGEWNLCEPDALPCASLVCLDNTWCPEGCYCTDDQLCDYTEREI